VNNRVAVRRGGWVVVVVVVVEVEVDVTTEGADELGDVQIGIVVRTAFSPPPPHPTRTPSRNTVAITTPRTPGP
jgi:hypothetical protein